MASGEGGGEGRLAAHAPRVWWGVACGLAPPNLHTHAHACSITPRSTPHALHPRRRGGWRHACAVDSGKVWRPYTLFNVTDDITTAARYVQARSMHIVAVISEATAAVNQAQAPRQP